MQVSALALVLACLGAPPASEPAAEIPPPTVETNALPSWTEAPVHEQDSPPAKPSKTKLPTDGGPGIVLGSMAIGAGLAMIAGSVALSVDHHLQPSDANEMLALMGSLATVSGSGVLAVGLLTRKKFRKTELGRAPDAPPTGRGMHGAAATMMAAGTLGTLIGSIVITLSGYECTTDCRAPGPEGKIVVGLSVGSLVSGSALLIASQVRGNRYRRWMDGRSAHVRPSFGAGTHGVALGLSGRF